MEIQKHFPAETTMEKLTFLNDNKADGLLYAYLQSLSMPYCVNKEENIYETRVDKAVIPIQKVAAEKVRLKTTKTYRGHLQYLIDRGYVIDCDDYYVLPDKIENQFLGIPLDTLKFLIDTVQMDVIKVYIYLGQKYKYAQSENRLYSFTRGEVLTHLGRNPNSQESLNYINNVLDCLMNNGLIRVVEFHQGKVPYLRLASFSFEYYKNFC